jgi:hypothetical protein
VDILGNGGLGEVVATTAWYTTSTTSKLVASPHANGSDYWIVQHLDGTDVFEAWLLTADGLQPEPVISHEGSPFLPTTFPTGHPDFRGPMKMSMLGDKLALAKLQGTIPDTSVTQIFDFDASTGVVRFMAQVNATCWRFAFGAPIYDFNPMRWTAGLEFSPDGSNLYVAAWDTLEFFKGNICWQYGLADTAAAAIQASGTYVCSNGNGMNGLLNDPAGSQLLLAPNQQILGRQVSTDPNEFYPTVWPLINLPVDVVPSSYQNNLDYQDIWTSTSLGGFPNPCKRYHDSEPLWLGTGPTPHAPPCLAVVPNPVADRAALHLSGRELPDELRWSDASGRMVRTSQIWRDGPTVGIDRGSLVDGLYNVTALLKGQVLGNVRVLCY